MVTLPTSYYKRALQHYTIKLLDDYETWRTNFDLYFIIHLKHRTEARMLIFRPIRRFTKAYADRYYYKLKPVFDLSVKEFITFTIPEQTYETWFDSFDLIRNNFRKFASYLAKLGYTKLPYIRSFELQKDTLSLHIHMAIYEEIDYVDAQRLATYWHNYPSNGYIKWKKFLHVDSKLVEEKELFLNQYTGAFQRWRSNGFQSQDTLFSTYITKYILYNKSKDNLLHEALMREHKVRVFSYSQALAPIVRKLDNYVKPFLIDTGYENDNGQKIKYRLNTDWDVQTVTRSFMDIVEYEKQKARDAFVLTGYIPPEEIISKFIDYSGKKINPKYKGKLFKTKPWIMDTVPNVSAMEEHSVQTYFPQS